jgi:hypothetical protein
VIFEAWRKCYLNFFGYKFIIHQSSYLESDGWYGVDLDPFCIDMGSINSCQKGDNKNR